MIRTDMGDDCHLVLHETASGLSIADGPGGCGNWPGAGCDFNTNAPLRRVS